ncbi:hypothetical protein GF420_13985 [candidate division GN15 bacterium]|nr:hypothetical protein [candidate division GN15 bacterium]
MDLFSDAGLRYVVILLLGYILTLSLSGRVVRLLIGRSVELAHTEPDTTPPSENRRRTIGLGTIIGKCENFLAVTLILADQVTGLALIFAAKSILRAEDMKNHPRVFLGGTLVNLCFSILMGFLIKAALGQFV